MNILVLIAAIALLTIGTGAVKGFAITLALGVLISMFSAITITKTILQITGMSLLGKNPMLFTPFSTKSMNQTNNKE